MMPKELLESIDEDSTPPEPQVIKSVPDIGIGAYVMMHGFKVVGRKGKNIYFSFAKSEQEEFDRLRTEYLSSPYHHFDHCLMSLKKYQDYMPN